jgi:hypothetical protein
LGATYGCENIELIIDEDMRQYNETLSVLGVGVEMRF